MGPEKGCGEEEQETQHAVVALMASNCCTWQEPRSVDWRDKHVVGVKVVLFFYSFRGRQRACNLQYKFCKRSERKEKVYRVLAQQILLALWNH